MNTQFGSYGEKNKLWSSDDAKGFIKILSTQNKIYQNINEKNKIKVGIIGASGYTGSELIRLLLLHPNIELKFALSKTNKNKKISDILIDLTGETEMIFSDKIEKDIDVLFLCAVIINQ